MAEPAPIPPAAQTVHSAFRPPAGPYRVFVSTPCDDGHRLCFWDSLRALERASILGHTKHRYRIYTTPGDSLIPRARNNHAHHFYTQTVDDFILSIDSDLDFRWQDVDNLFDNAGPVMAGKYAIKTEALQWCLNSIPGQLVDLMTQRQFVSTAGTGFLAVHRHVIGTLYTEADQWTKWPIRYVEDGSGRLVHDIYHNGVVRDPEWFPTAEPYGRYLSEDWGFCYLARRHGFSITCDHRCIALHEGHTKYPTQLRRLTQDETARGVIQQPDGTVTPIQ